MGRSTGSRLQLSTMPASAGLSREAVRFARRLRHPVPKCSTSTSTTTTLLYSLALSLHFSLARPGYPSRPSSAAPLDCAVLLTPTTTASLSTNNSTGRLARCALERLQWSRDSKRITHHHFCHSLHITPLGTAFLLSQPTSRVLQISTVMR